MRDRVHGHTKTAGSAGIMWGILIRQPPKKWCWYTVAGKVVLARHKWLAERISMTMVGKRGLPKPYPGSEDDANG